MANASSTGFGLKPLKKAGQNRDAGGLGEYPVAASSTAIYNQDLVAMANTGNAAVAAAATEQNLGSLNGVFFTNASTGLLVCFSFCERSSDMLSISQSVPNH